jgi:hypothetical protein
MPVLQQVSGTALTGFADQLLLDRASVQSEGEVERDRDRGATFLGSTMITIPLDEGSVAGASDRRGTDELLDAARNSIALHIRLMRIARREAERRCAPLLPRGMLTDIQFKIEDARLFVDICVECPLADPSREVEGAEDNP